jgi:hypothetical protein
MLSTTGTSMQCSLLKLVLRNYLVLFRPRLHGVTTHWTVPERPSWCVPLLQEQQLVLEVAECLNLI